MAHCLVVVVVVGQDQRPNSVYHSVEAEGVRPFRQNSLKEAWVDPVVAAGRP